MSKILEWLSKPENHPSWLTSTLSQLAMISVICFAGMGIYTGIKICTKAIDPATAKLVMEPFGWLVTTFSIGYAVARKNNGGNGTPPPQGGTT